MEYISTSTQKMEQKPKDTGWCVFLAFYYIGVAILMPYSMMITMSPFWIYKFRNTTLPDNSTQLTELQKNFPGYLSLSGNLPSTLMVILTALFGWKINIHKRLIISGILVLLAFGGLTFLAGYNTDSIQDELLILVLCFNVLYSLANGVFQPSFLGNVSKFPLRYIGCPRDGMGLGATLPALISIGIKALEPPLQYTGLFCIAFATGVLLLLVPLYLWVSSTPFYQHYSASATSAPTGVQTYIKVFKSGWIFFLIIFYNFFLTLSVYPAVAVLVKSVSPEQSDWNNKYFVLGCCFLLQSVGDWFGRSLATFSQWPRPGRPAEIGLALAVLGRTAFLPLIMVCNVAPNNRTTEVQFESDAVYIGLISTFSILGGYIGNVGCMLGSKKVDPDIKEATGSVLVASLVLGLGAGSLMGPVLVSWL